jgi:tetratricopeptide (TPR) repeat protein
MAPAIQRYRTLRQSNDSTYNFDESELNELGYQFLGLKKTQEAIEILKLNAEEYPSSSNVYDGLGEAYMEHGDKELAIQNYKKSLELDPKNSNAVSMLKKLKR